MADKEGNLDAVLKEAVDLVTTGFLLRRFLGCSLVECPDKAPFGRIFILGLAVARAVSFLGSCYLYGF